MEAAKGEVHVINWHVAECTTFKAPGGCKFGDACIFKHTAKSGDEKKISASIAFHTPSNDERQMQLRKIQSDAKTQYRLRLHHLAKKNVLTRKKIWDLHLESSRPGSHNQRNPNAPTFEDRSIEWTSSMEEKARKAAWIFLHKNLYKVAGSYSENRHNVFRPSPASNVSSPSLTKSKETEFIVDSGASLHMLSKSDLTSEEQETIQKSKGPAVIVTRSYNVCL